MLFSSKRTSESNVYKFGAILQGVFDMSDPQSLYTHPIVSTLTLTVSSVSTHTSQFQNMVDIMFLAEN